MRKWLLLGLWLLREYLCRIMERVLIMSELACLGWPPFGMLRFQHSSRFCLNSWRAKQELTLWQVQISWSKPRALLRAAVSSHVLRAARKWECKESGIAYLSPSKTKKKKKCLCPSLSGSFAQKMPAHSSFYNKCQFTLKSPVFTEALAVSQWEGTVKLLLELWTLVSGESHSCWTN